MRMKKGQMTIILKRMLSYGLILCLVVGITDVYSLSANAEEVMQGQQVYAEGASERAGADGADDTEVIPETANQEEVETGEVEDESSAEEPVVEDGEGSDIVEGDDSNAGEEEEVTEETPSDAVYDPQPTNRQEVEAIINAFQGAWEEAVAAGGDLEAVLATKPHWEQEVPEEWMPGGYRCELVTDDSDFGMPYYTFFTGVMSTVSYSISDFTTLKSVIEGAAANSNLDIEITAGFDFTGSITVPTGVKVTLHSVAGSNYTLLQTTDVRHFIVNGELVLKDITLDGGALSSTANVRGGVRAGSGKRITIEEGTIIQYCRGWNGGGVQLDNGSEMIMNGGTITNNVTEINGGGVGLPVGASARIIINGGAISYNRVFSQGGCGGGIGAIASITVSELSFTLNGGTINNNHGGSGGGGIAMPKGTFTMTGGKITENDAIVQGGGVCIGKHNQSGNTAITGSGDINLIGGTINNNRLSSFSYSSNIVKKGGGIFACYVPGGSYTMHIDGTVISNNTSVDHGGGIAVDGGIDIVMDSGEISNNAADIDGGGAAQVYGGDGGGIYVPSTGDTSIEVKGGEIKNNTATNGFGAGVYWGETSDSVKASFSGCTISGNIIPTTSLYAGAGIYSADTTYSNLIVAPDVVFADNKVGTETNNYYQPISNIAALYPNIQFARTSFTGTNTLRTNHALNNYDISYRSYTITYSPNGGTGTSYYDFADPHNPHTVLSNGNENLRYGKSGNAFVGWNTEPSGDGTAYAEGAQFTPTYDINLYAQWTSGGSVKISNTIAGTYANMNKIFDIQIVLKDGSGTPVSRTLSYTGASTVSGVPAPANGRLTFDSAGSATIQLKHGQAITLEVLPGGYQYQVIEPVSSSSGYSVTYNGTVSTTGFSDTIASSDVTVVIENTRDIIPSTGVDEGGGTGGLLISVTTVFAVGMLSLYYFRKRNREST